LVNVRLATIPHECAAELSKNAPHCTVVNIDISPIDVAEGLLDAAM
jgi:hypothetical protein